MRKEDRNARTMRTFDALVEQERPDLVVADDAYELEGAHAQGAGKGWPPFVFLWDFVKVYPGSWRWMDLRTARLVNKGWDRAFRKGREAGSTDLFLGELDDVPDERLGLGMVNARQGAEKRYHFVGNPLPFDPAEYADRAAVHARLGYGRGRLLICSTGGTAVGADLLRLCLRAVPLMRASAPDLNVLIVRGPRMGTDLGEVPQGAEVRGYVPRLFEHFAAADMAIVQGGGASTLELAALRVPFLYFPLKGHSEQEMNVARKLERNGLGIRCDIAWTTPEERASLVMGNIGKVPGPPSLSFDGCRHAARAIAKVL